jgi:hypothetical protein
MKVKTFFEVAWATNFGMSVSFMLTDKFVLAAVMLASSNIFIVGSYLAKMIEEMAADRAPGHVSVLGKE